MVVAAPSDKQPDVSPDVSSVSVPGPVAAPRERLITGLASDTGAVRATNEDAVGVSGAHRLCVLADGMGGHNAGEVASRVAVDTVLGYMNAWADKPESAGGWSFGYDRKLSESGNRVRSAVCMADRRIHELAAVRPRYAGMGTTVVAAAIRNGLLSVAHAGDSRLYVYSNDCFRQLTRDDTWLSAMVADGSDETALEYHPMRHALTNVLGTSKRADVHMSERPLSGGELLLLTTDGVHGVLEPPSFRRMLDSGKDLEAMAQGLVAAAIRCGSRDNCTALVAQYVRD